MDKILNKIIELEKDTCIIDKDLQRVKNSNYYTTIQQKEFETNLKKRKSTLEKEKKHLEGEIFQTILQVHDVNEEGKGVWNIKLLKKYSDNPFDVIFFDVEYDSLKGEFNELIFKLVKGDLVTVKIEITLYRHMVYGQLMSIYKTSNEKCFIATVCFGSSDSKEVVLFRRFRDEVLLKFLLGRIFITLYYSLSPRISIIVDGNMILKNFFKNLVLNPLYHLIRLFRFL
jgi:hypothetical protein